MYPVNNYTPVNHTFSHVTIAINLSTQLAHLTFYFILIMYAMQTEESKQSLSYKQML